MLDDLLLLAENNNVFDITILIKNRPGIHRHGISIWGWVFTDTKDAALEGVYSGEYYAAVIISSDFTYSMYNVFREDFKGPTISYYENEKKNAVATKITEYQ